MCVYNGHVSGCVQLKLMLFKGQLYLDIWSLNAAQLFLLPGKLFLQKGLKDSHHGLREIPLPQTGPSKAITWPLSLISSSFNYLQSSYHYLIFFLVYLIILSAPMTVRLVFSPL